MHTHLLTIPLLFLPLISAIPAHTNQKNATARIRIDVGSSGAPALVFNPNSIKANVGDTLDFHFIDENIVSSVLLGTEAAACKPAMAAPSGAAAGGQAFFNSGPILGEKNGTNIFSVAVTSPAQMVLYCGVGAHCQAGMVAVVNPNSPDTLQKYTQAAMVVQMAAGPPNMTGGKFTQGITNGPVIIGFAPGAGPKRPPPM